MHRTQRFESWRPFLQHTKEFVWEKGSALGIALTPDSGSAPCCCPSCVGEDPYFGLNGSPQIQIMNETVIGFTITDDNRRHRISVKSEVTKQLNAS